MGTALCVIWWNDRRNARAYSFWGRRRVAATKIREIVVRPSQQILTEHNVPGDLLTSKDGAVSETGVRPVLSQGVQSQRDKY